MLIKPGSLLYIVTLPADRNIDYALLSASNNISPVSNNSACSTICFSIMSISVYLSFGIIFSKT